MLSARHARRHQRGFTLVELAVASAIALFILSGVLYIFTASVGANTRALKNAYLHQSLLSVMAVMRDELRRAGYWRRAEETVVSGARNGFAPIRIVDPDCVLFSYDRDKDDPDGRPDAEDQAGFRLSSDRIQAKTRDDRCSGTTCSTCDSGHWRSVTDPKSVVVSELRFVRSGATPPPGRIVVRELSIVITGRLRNDPAVVRTLRDTVNIRNDETP